jgi:hypothetical protein
MRQNDEHEHAPVAEARESRQRAEKVAQKANAAANRWNLWLDDVEQGERAAEGRR